MSCHACTELNQLALIGWFAHRAYWWLGFGAAIRAKFYMICMGLPGSADHGYGQPARPQRCADLWHGDDGTSPGARVRKSQSGSAFKRAATGKAGADLCYAVCVCVCAR